jgi:thiosulfate/3-mercaptopyruvate sulfurtransferase
MSWTHFLHPMAMSDTISDPPLTGTATITGAQLTTAEALIARLDRGDEGPLRLIHVAGRKEYEQYHLPGALLVEPGELIDGTPPAVGRLPSRERLEALFGRLGYRSDDALILYDDEGGGWAGRFAWTLDVIGHENWTYLDGGIHAWADAGGELAAGPCDYPAPTSVSLTIDTHPIAEVEDVLNALSDPDQIIWDVRSREEYLGLRSGSARAGHIPGARHLDWMHLKDPERALRLVENLPELLAEHGIDPRLSTITHCQTHHRSGLSYMVGRLLGFKEIRAYHGSWSEWGNRDDLPVTDDS